MGAERVLDVLANLREQDTSAQRRAGRADEQRVVSPSEGAADRARGVRPGAVRHEPLTPKRDAFVRAFLAVVCEGVGEVHRRSIGSRGRRRAATGVDGTGAKKEP